MKTRNLLITLAGLLMITGCGNNDIKLDLEKVEIELNSLVIEEDGEKTNLFENSIRMSEEKLEDKYGVDTSLFEEILITTSENLDTASMYAIFLPKEEKVEEAENEMESFFEKYDQAWIMGYFPEEEKLVENRLEEKYGDYYIYIISEDNEMALEKIKNTK